MLLLTCIFLTNRRIGLNSHVLCCSGKITSILGIYSFRKKEENRFLESTMPLHAAKPLSPNLLRNFLSQPSWVMRPVWDYHLEVLRTAPFTILPQRSSWLPAFLKVCHVSQLHFTLFSLLLFLSSHVIAICQSEPSHRAWLEFRRSSVGLLMAIQRTLTLLRTPWASKVTWNSLSHEKKYSLPNIT